ncbi:MAG TPA: long-chain fatty acid--CoA ligase [Solirubrobacteraceae bacterium]|jgi:long-subunit acyl-CoA synthetase (AMP-forming)|nr:long-chain fatty acid--CoA ligase [Solirubrobacteraceae bacterium]
MTPATSTELQSAIERALSARTLCETFQITADANADRPALVVAGESELSWKEYADRVRTLAAGLWSLGVRRGDAVALLLANRPEFHLADTAAIHLGAAPFSIYHTNPAEQIVPLLENSGARVVITEPAYAERIAQVRALGSTLEHVVIVDGDGSDGTLTLAEIEQDPADVDFDFEQSWRAVEPDDCVTLVYTSGTTGAPKGVEHTHGGLVFGLNSMQGLSPVSPAGRVVSYLPMAHIAERYISHYSSMGFGYTIGCCPDPSTLAATLAAIRPTRLFGVPRIFEKLRDGALAMIEADEKMTGAYALSLATVRARHEQGLPQEGRAPCSAPEALAPVREKLGLDQAEWIGVAAAPTPLSVLETFHAIGLPITELWGMSETVLSTSNPPGRVKLGTVGIHLPGVEVKLADDGEILVRGPQVTRGYRRDPERTAEALIDGWMYTGDVAISDAEGYLKIVDRKKELIINSAGKNMSPTHIEGTVKGESTLIAYVVAIGDARPYVTALIVLDPEAGARYASERGLPESLDALAASEAVQQEIAGAVARANEHLPRVEQIKKHTILATPWLPGGEEITPTMKLRRKPIAQRYAQEIEELYA